MSALSYEGIFGLKNKRVYFRITGTIENKKSVIKTKIWYGYEKDNYNKIITYL